MRRSAEESGSPARESFGLLEICLADLRVFRRRLYLFTAFATAAALAILLLLPNKYTAAARFLPQDITPGNRLASLAASVMPSDLLSSSILPGMKSEGSKLRGLYQSNRFLDAVLKRKYESRKNNTSQTLYVLFEEPHKEYARVELQDRIKLDEDIKSTMMTLAATTNDPVLSANLANACFEELDKLKKEMEKESAAEELAFLSAQITKEEENLKQAENDQSEYLLKNRNYMTGDDPVLRQKVTEYEARVIYYSNVLVELNKLVTMAEMSLNRDVPRLTLVERADIPLLKSWPPRLRYLVMSLIGAILFGVGIVFLLNAYQWYFPSDTRKEFKDSVSVVRSDMAGLIDRLKKRNRSIERISS